LPSSTDGERDYYRFFLALNSDKLMAGRSATSAAKEFRRPLLMATNPLRVHPVQHRRRSRAAEAASVGAAAASALMLASESGGTDASPAMLLTLLNHQALRKHSGGKVRDFVSGNL